jgi:AraC-like DNA-binding protein
VILPFRAVMLVQMLYTGSCVYELVSARRRGVDGAELRWPARFVALAIVVHLAQLLRAMGFATQEFRNIVPITAIAALEILAIIACREAILAPRSPAKRPREPVACDDSELLATIDAAMRTNRLWSDAGLSLDGLASAVGSTPHRVSGALNASRGGFFEYVSSFRLEAARAALADPANDRYTIDAIAENAGFRSRSSFYAAFRKRFGITPSELRKARSLHDPSAPPASRRESGCPEAIR